MKRNPDILREIMLVAEATPAGHKLRECDLKTSSKDPHEVADHVQQLIEQGLLGGVVHFTHDPREAPVVVIDRITSRGHDFIQATRDDAIWRVVKEKVMRPLSSWTIQLAVEYAQKLAREKLGLDQP